MKKAALMMTLVLLGTVVFHVGGPAGAQEQEGTRVESVSATGSGSVAHVEGTATFVDAPVVIVTDPTGDAVVAGIGADLVDLVFSRPDPFGDHLRVTYSIFDQPEDLAGVPEGICYLMTGDSPSGGSSSWVADVYRTSQVFNPGSLEPVANLRYGIDSTVLPARVADGVVEFDLPMELVGAEPGDVMVRGSLLKVGNIYAAAALRPSCIPVVADYDKILGEGREYAIPEATVSLGIAPTGTPPSTIPAVVQATVEPDGSFSGSLSLSERPPGTYTVVARACYGEGNCGEATTTLTI